MGRLNPYSLSLQITRLFEQGQSFFASSQVETWLRERHHDPSEYEILFHQEIPPPDAPEAMRIRIELKRHDHQPVDPWLLEQINSEST